MSQNPRKTTKEWTKLTDTVVWDLKPKEGTYTVWDGGHQACVQGLGVRVMPSGVKSFVWKYVVNGKQRWMTIGKTSAWSVAAARKRVSSLSQDLDKGVDPANVIASDKANPYTTKLAKKFLEEHCSKRKPLTKSGYKFLINTYILPVLKNIQVKDITSAHVAQIHADMADKPTQANRVLAVLSSMLSLAETWGYRSPNSNPCGTVERYPESKKTRFLSPEEISRLLDTLRAQEEKFPYQVKLFRLLLLTGARLREVLHCRWSAKAGGNPIHPYLNREAGCIHCEDHKGSRKGGPKDIILSRAALEVIDTIDQRLGSPYLFPSAEDSQKPLTNPHHVWLTLKATKRGAKERKGIRDLAGLPDVRLHDLRHSFGTLSVSLNQNPAIRQKLLGHASASTTERYSHADIDPLRAAVEQIGETIIKLRKA